MEEVLINCKQCIKFDFLQQLCKAQLLSVHQNKPCQNSINIVPVSLAQVRKTVKAVLSHQAGAELMKLKDQWGRSCLHHAAATVCCCLVRYLINALIERSGTFIKYCT